MADTTDKKTYLINIQDNLDKYIKETIEAKKRVDELTAANKALKDSGEATATQIEKSNADLRNAQKEYTNSKKLVDLSTQANKAQVGSYEQLYKQWQIAQTQLKLLGGAITTNEQGVRVLSQRYIEQSKVVADAKKGLDDFGKGVHDNRLNVGSYSEAIEGAIGKFQMMPGPVGAAASAVSGVGTAFKALIANPIVAAIAAIVAVFAGLIKIFKGTAEGGGKIKDLFAAIGAIINELRARVVSFIDIFSHIFKGEWKEAGAAAKETFTGIGESLKEAAENAAELSKQQRQLTKELAMHISEEANEVKRIQELLYLSKDKSKTDAERLAFLKEALTLGKEQADREVEYAKRQWDIDVATAAQKAKINEETLAKWVAMDADAQNEMLKNHKELQAAYNLIGGADALKALETSYAKQAEAQKEFFAHNKRAISQSSALEEELRRDREAKYKAHLERMQKATDDNIKLMFLKAKGDDEKTKEALKFQLDSQLKNQKLSNTERLILQEEYRLAVNEIDQKAVKESQEALKKEVDDYNKSIEEKKKKAEDYAEWELERKTINAENKLVIDELNNVWEFELQREALKIQYDQEIASAEKTGADINLIKLKYSLASKEIDRLEFEAKTELWAGFAGNLATIFGRATAIGKMAAVAETTISTYAAAQKAYESVIEIPVVGPVLAIVAAAAAVAAGIANVKKILAVKSGLPGDSGGTASAPTSISASAPAQRMFAPLVGSSYLTQPQLTQPQINALPNQNLLTAADIAEAIKKIPAPIVTVEDINAKAAAVNKVEVRGNI